MGNQRKKNKYYKAEITRQSGVYIDIVRFNRNNVFNYLQIEPIFDIINVFSDECDALRVGHCLRSCRKSAPVIISLVALETSGEDTFAGCWSLPKQTHTVLTSTL